MTTPYWESNAMRTGMRVSSFVLIGALLVAPGVALAGQQPKYEVSVKASKPAALAKAKTYTWTASQPSFDKNIDQQIIAAVDRELQARGLTKAATAPGDLVVTYASVSRSDVDLKSKGKDGELREFSVGTLVVDVRDTNRQSLFRVRIDKPIQSDPAAMEATINAAVAAMFEKYPGAPKR
jgi:hypothetical protein